MQDTWTGFEEAWRLAFVCGTVALCTWIVFLVGKPLLRDLMADLPASQVEADATAGNAHLARKQQQQQQEKDDKEENKANHGELTASYAEDEKTSVASHACWGCGASGTSFKACALCVQNKMELPCRFCSSNCLKTHWPRHKHWHTSQAEHVAIQQALRAAEDNGERISVPAKRTPKRKGEAKTGTTNQQGAAAGDESATLERAEKQQSDRERSQLSHALVHLSEQLERDNAGGSLAASRADFGRLVAQIDELLEARRATKAIDACFNGLAVDGRVDLRAFLHAPSTVAWFLSDGTRSSVGQAVNKPINTGNVEEHIDAQE
jgi:hypothetical protein